MPGNGNRRYKARPDQQALAEAAIRSLSVRQREHVITLNNFLVRIRRRSRLSRPHARRIRVSGRHHDILFPRTS